MVARHEERDCRVRVQMPDLLVGESRTSEASMDFVVTEWKWQHITMDFVVGLPATQKGHNGVWVVVDRLTKMAHFLPFNTKWSVAKLARYYVREVVRLHTV